MERIPAVRRVQRNGVCCDEVSTPQGEEMAQRVEERDKKRMLLCNGADRGSKFAPARKGADLSHGVSWQEMEVNL